MLIQLIQSLQLIIGDEKSSRQTAEKSWSLLGFGQEEQIRLRDKMARVRTVGSFNIRGKWLNYASTW
ncbi:hypothetical protein ACROYT_G000250 [Oculina patagonica]